jgi:hypothetical protein
MACFVFALVAYLVIRNESIADPQIASMLRIFISLAVNVLGATIPGLLQVDWSLKGFTIRAAGALALFVITYFYSPKLAPDLDTNRVPPLVNPRNVSQSYWPWSPQMVFAAEPALTLRRALQGDSSNKQEKLYDLTISNSSQEQRILTTFHVRWLYRKGGTTSVEEGLVLKPSQKYSLEIPLDVEQSQAQEADFVLSPAILLPPANVSGPSIITIRLQLLYKFVGLLHYHPSGTWELYYEVAVKDDWGERLTLLSRGWKSDRNSDWTTKYSISKAASQTSRDVVQVDPSNRTFCFPSNYQLEMSASGEPGYGVAVNGRLDPRVKVLVGLERVGPNHPVIVDVLEKGVSSFTTPGSGESDEGCYKFELGSFRIDKLPIKDVRGDNWDPGDFSQITPKADPAYVEISGLEHNFRVKISWHRLK